MSDETQDSICEYNREHHPRPPGVGDDCPSGCGCVTEDDPDRNDCACDGPCCMDPGWPNGYVGLREDEATVRAMNDGYSVRIAKRDGVDFVLTSDYHTDRINFKVEQDVVTATFAG